MVQPEVDRIGERAIKLSKMLGSDVNRSDQPESDRLPTFLQAYKNRILHKCLLIKS